MKVKIKKLHPSAVIPKYSKPGDAGADLTAISMEYDNNTDTVTFGFGIALEIPDGHYGMIVPRSSIYKTNMFLSNHCGIVDSNFRGEIKAIFRTVPTYKTEQYKVGDRVAQLIIMKYPSVTFQEVDELSETERGTSGWGSSGK